MSRKKGRPRELFHGGVAGLNARDQLLPAGGPVYEYASPQFVYLTADRDVARAYAARCYEGDPNGSGGSLYSVTVKGPLEPDPDYRLDPGVCWKAKVAFVAKVEETEVPFTVESMLPALRLVWWDDGTARMFSPEGYAMPSEMSRASGVTEGHLRHLGKCPSPVAVTQTVDRLAKQQIADPAKAQALLRWTEAHAPQRVDGVRSAIRKVQGR